MTTPFFPSCAFFYSRLERFGMRCNSNDSKRRHNLANGNRHPHIRRDWKYIQPSGTANYDRVREIDEDFGGRNN
jgi:hypothetical protein